MQKYFSKTKLNNCLKKNSQYIILILFVGIILFFISPDSYLFYPIGKCDSALFYMGGKAMMNGMIPYVEFTDSKGLLLWLIYGVGYLISKTDYTGLFWIEWFSYSISFIYMYRLAYLFLNSKKKSLGVCVFMTAFIFNTWCRNEVRAEDWCLPFVLMSIYYSCKALYFDNRLIKTAFGVTGLSVGACCMIKYSISLMLLSVIIYLFFSFIRNIKSVFVYGGMIFVSITSILAPFFIYLHMVNALAAFFNEYFINTFYTISSINDNPLIAYLRDMIMVLSKPELCVLFICSLWGCLSITKYYKNDRYFLVFVLFFFWIIVIKHSLFYYFSICTFFPVFAIISLLKDGLFKNMKLAFSIIICLYVLITNIFSSYYNPKYIRPDYRIKKSGYYYEQAKFDSVLNKYEHPTIFYYRCLDRGDGIKCQALPAAKYWFLQNGATKEMELYHLKAIKSRCADFVITEDIDSLTMCEKVNMLKGIGYKYCIDIKQQDRCGIRYRTLLINPIAERKVNYKGNIYIYELSNIRKKTKKYEADAPKMFFFGMGNRIKYIFRDSVLIDLNTNHVIRNYSGADSINILPDKYEVDIFFNHKTLKIYENEEGVWVSENKYQKRIDSINCNINLPLFTNYKYASVLRVLHHEILFNIKNSAVYPNILVYKEPFYRDAFMAALCLEKTNNIHLLIPWIEKLSNLYDMQNGEPEADNLGELLYLLSYLPDSPSKRKKIERIMNEVSRITISKDGKTYIKGKTDGQYNALYPTLILKMALAKNKMKDNYSEEAERGEYDDLCWFWQHKPHCRSIERWYKDFRFNYLDSPFPYLQWARAHFYDNTKMPFNSGDYPLSWECRGGSADFNGMEIVSKDAVERKICYPHVWTAAEMFLRLYELSTKQ